MGFFSSCVIGSVVVVCGLSCPKACKILPPDQRLNLGLLHWEFGVLVPGSPGTSPLLPWSPLPVSMVQNSPGFPSTLLYLCSSSLLSCSFPALFLNNSVPHIYAPGPLTFLILYAFIKRYSRLYSCFQLPYTFCWLPNLYFQLIFLFWVSNLYSQLPTKMMCPKGKAYSTCLIMNPSNFLPKCVPSCVFIIRAGIQSEPWCFKGLCFLSGGWLPTGRKQKLPSQLRVMSVAGASSLLLNYIAQTSHKVHTDSIEWRHWLPHYEGVSSSYCKRLCGVGGIIVTIFGKCNLQQQQNQKSNSD